MRFVDHGIAAEVAESRGVVTLRDSRGRNLVIACSNDQGPRGWILVTDIDTGETKQVFFPDGVSNAPPYASLLSRNGRFYTGAGRVLLEYDPATEQWLSWESPQPDAHCFVGEALADGPEGLIFGGTCYNSHLFSFDPATRRTVDTGGWIPRRSISGIWLSMRPAGLIAASAQPDGISWPFIRRRASGGSLFRKRNGIWVRRSSIEASTGRFMVTPASAGID